MVMIPRLMETSGEEGERAKRVKRTKRVAMDGGGNAFACLPRSYLKLKITARKLQY